MPRQPRGISHYDGCFAHVFSRSIEKRRIFGGVEDFELFLSFLKEAKKRYPFKLFHYCLMHTHFHMAVRMESVERFSNALKYAKWQFVHQYNKARKRRGTVWQERFKSLVIEDEAYLRACGIYIENNPVEIGLVSDSSEWKYSSARYHELGEKDELVDEYHFDGSLPTIPADTRQFFEKGIGIGGSYFQIYRKDDIG